VRYDLPPIYVLRCIEKTNRGNWYRSKSYAKRQASRFRREVDAPAVSWYRCLWCGLYHLGTKRERLKGTEE
jgi:hypothetical protein